MASITIRRLDERIKARLRMRAAQHDRSMEEEAREILKAGLLTTPRKQSSLAESIRRKIEAAGGVDLELPARAPMRKPPRIGR
jgi:antitoxin FitA